jgi:hypothetical protein
MATIRIRNGNVPLEKVKDKESRDARKRAVEVEDMEISAAFARYKKIRESRLEQQNSKRLEDKEYLV